MRKRRNFAAFLLSAAIAASACTAALPAFTASADDTYTITMSTRENHTYTAYQVFTGTLYENGGTKTLSNIQWGSGVNGSAILTALKDSTKNTYSSDFTSCNSAADVAKVLDGYKTSNSTDKIKAVSKIIGANTTTAQTGLTGLAAGYYLIKDTTAQNGMPEGNTYSEFMLEVVSNVSVTAKDETVSSNKTVSDINDSTDTAPTAADQTHETIPLFR